MADCHHQEQPGRRRGGFNDGAYERCLASGAANLYTQFATASANDQSAGTPWVDDV
jgi:hypothetical protein